jgi:DNA-binding transcriptional LysR family regulator
VAHQNLPTDLLRTFVTVADHKSFTRAGELLGRTQPAISLQIRRLEDLLGCELISTRGRANLLTPEGEEFSRFARQMLCLNDEIVARVQHRRAEGSLRVGLPVDYAGAFFQQILTRFLREHPEVDLEIVCEVSKRLLDRLENGDLDVVVAMYEGPAPSNLAFAWAERPIWVAAADFAPDRKTAIRLLAHNEGCEYRARMIRALDEIGRHWRIVYSSPGIGGLQTAVLSRLGITALTQRTLLPGMAVLGEETGLPSLDDVHVGLHYKHSVLSIAGKRLAGEIMTAMQQSGQTDLIRIDRPFRTTAA